MHPAPVTWCHSAEGNGYSFVTSLEVFCARVHAKLLQSCLTLCDPVDPSPLGSSAHGILQARILEWVPCPPPGDFSDPGIEPASHLLHWQADSLPLALPGKFFDHGPAVKVNIWMCEFILKDHWVCQFRASNKQMSEQN